MILRHQGTWLYQGIISGLVAGSTLFCLSEPGATQRRPVPDNTLGDERSRVIPNVVVDEILGDRIDGGAQRGANLFHSFEAFGVENERAVYFSNPPGIEHILSRVTGETRSEIFGRLGVLGDADLFLLNPNGILFGPNSSLDVRGSFIATTADAIRLDAEGLFSASEPETSALLTVQPSALVFLNPRSQPIVNRSVFIGSQLLADLAGGPTGLQVPSGQTLALVGGNLILKGGGLTATGGRIELGSVNQTGEVQLRPHPQGWRLAYNSIQNFGLIQLESGALVNAGILDQGTIRVHTAQLRLLEGSRVYNQPLLSGGNSGGGNLVIHATDLVEFAGINQRFEGRVIPGGLATSTSGPFGSQPGDIVINTRRFVVRDGAAVSAASFNPAVAAGNIRINASESVVLDGAALIQGQPDRLFITNLATGGPGETGSIRINTQRLMVENGAILFTSTTGVSGGDLIINASESVRLSGFSVPARIDDDSDPVRVPAGLYADTLTSEPTDAVRDSRILINTDRLRIDDGAVISVSFLSPQVGQGGGVDIRASESIEIMGASPNGIRSGIYAQSFAAGRSGDLSVTTGDLFLGDGGQISVDATGTAPGGVRLSLLKDTLRAILPDLNLDDAIDEFAPPAQRGTGEAGDIQIRADSVRLDAGAITASTPSRDGGSITLDTLDLLVLRRGGRISTEAGIERQGGGGNGGNISIDADFVVAAPFDNSDINANAFDGRGGNIDITAQGLFGIEFRDNPTVLSDITASSEFGIDGDVSIETPVIDPSRGLAELPEDVIDASQQVTRACPSGEGVATPQGEFVVTGRGGLPPAPDTVHSSGTSVVDLVAVEPEDDPPTEAHASASPSHPAPVQPITEAQGWLVADDGSIVLTAAAPAIAPDPASNESRVCPQ